MQTNLHSAGPHLRVPPHEGHVEGETTVYTEDDTLRAGGHDSHEALRDGLVPSNRTLHRVQTRPWEV